MLMKCPRDVGGNWVVVDGIEALYRGRKVKS